MKVCSNVASTLVLLAFASAAQAQQEPLGRLFFTPEQRAMLDRQRQLTPSRMVGTGGESSSSYTINGVVRRSSGHQTTWINGIPVDDVPPLAGGGHSLRAGETLDATSGKRKDVLHGGEIVVRQPLSTSSRK